MGLDKIPAPADALDPPPVRFILMDGDKHILGDHEKCCSISGTCSEQSCEDLYSSDDKPWVHYQAMYGGYATACEVHDLEDFEWTDNDGT